MSHPASWYEMKPEERVIHYNRNLPKGCNHKADFLSWPKEMRESYSFDPYAHTPHMEPHIPNNKKCECQMCIYKIGNSRD